VFKTEFMRPKLSQGPPPAPAARRSDLENRDWLPKYPREGHVCKPDYHELVKMSRQEISHLRSFKIVNELFGEIEFLAPDEGIDLTFVDL